MIRKYKNINEWFDSLPIVKDYEEMIEIDKNYELKKLLTK